MTEKILSEVKCKRQMGFCEEFTSWHFVTKCAAVKFIKPGMSNHFTESRDPNCIGSAICPKFPRKDWRGKSCWLDPRKCNPEVVQGPGVVTTFPTLLGHVLVWSQQNYLKCLWTVRYFESLIKLPHDPPQKERGHKTEWSFSVTFELEFLPLRSHSNKHVSTAKFPKTEEINEKH